VNVRTHPSFARRRQRAERAPAAAASRTWREDIHLSSPGASVTTCHLQASSRCTRRHAAWRGDLPPHLRGSTAGGRPESPDLSHTNTRILEQARTRQQAQLAQQSTRARTQVVELRIVLDAFRAHVLLELREKIVSSVAARRDPAALDDHVLPRHSLLSPAVVLVVAFHLRRCGRSAVRRARRRQPRRRRLAHPDDREDRDLCADVAATGRGVVGARDPVLASLAIQYVGSGDLDGHRAPLCACSPAASEASFTAEKIVPGRSGGYQGYH
jgi:hypothetical protein